MLILFHIGYVELIALRKLYKEIKMLTKIDWLFIVRHLVISIYSWVLSPLLINRLHESVALIIMFSFTIFISFVFIKMEIQKKVYY